MKKIFSIILSVLITATLTVVAAAAPSPTGTGIAQVQSATDGNNNSIGTIQMKPVSSALSQDAQKPNTIKMALGNNYQDGMQTVAIWDLIVPAGTVFPIKITFSVPGVTSSTTGAFMHWNGTEFEMITAIFANGTMTGTFNSLSPVAIVLDSQTAAAIEQVYGYDPSVDPSSPQTGIADMTWIYVVSTICLGGSAVALAASKKKAAACC